MSHYLLSTHAGTGRQPARAPTPEQMRTFMERIVALEADMDSQSAFVFGGRLADPDAAPVVRAHDGDVALTDGPFVEAKEHIAGFYIIDAADLDEALAWAARVADATGAPIEVRPFLATGKAADQTGQMPGSGVE